MKLIKKIFKQECWACKGQIKKIKKNCTICNGTGIYKENSHIIIFGKQAIDSDNIG